MNNEVLTYLNLVLSEHFFKCNRLHIGTVRGTLLGIFIWQAITILVALSSR